MAGPMRHKRGPARYAFIGGLWYGGTDLGAPTTVAPRPGLGDRYGRMRVADEMLADGTLLRSGHYLKAPVAVVQSANGATLWELTPVPGRLQPFIGLRLDGAGADLRLAHLPHHLAEKSQTHFGAWQKEEELIPLAPVACSVNRHDGDDWRVLLREYAARLMQGAPAVPEPARWRTAARLARHYLRRCYDPQTGVHAEFMRRHLPAHVGGAELFSLTAYELERALTLDEQGESAAARAAWDAIIMNEAASVLLPELGGARLWHNTAGRRAGRLFFHTEYATGLAGYPGGQANLLAAAVQLAARHPDWPGADRLRAGCDWLRRSQLPDGGWALVYPTLPAREEAQQRQATAAVAATGATAAAARALLRAAAATGEPAYRESALRGLRRINPRPPVYAFVGSGFLRDAGETEQDGVSGAELLQANLLAWRQTGEREWLDVAVALGCFLIGWQRGRGRVEYCGLVDPMVSSFAPRLALWDTMLWAEAWLDLAAATGDAFWRELGEWTAAKVLPFQDARSGGWSESWALDADGQAHPFYLENGITVWGLRLAEKMGVVPAAGEQGAPSGGGVACASGMSLPAVSARVVLHRPPAWQTAARRLVPRPLRRLVRRWRGRLAPVDDELLPDLAVVPEEVVAAEQLGWRVITDFAGTWRLTLTPPGETPVSRVFFPVLRWAQPVTAASITGRCGGCVTECRVEFAGRTLRLGFPALPVDNVWTHAGALVCETTLKSFWSVGASLTVVVEARDDV